MCSKFHIINIDTELIVYANVIRKVIRKERLYRKDDKWGDIILRKRDTHTHTRERERYDIYFQEIKSFLAKVNIFYEK